MNFKRVIVYVEGPSDKLAMQALLSPLLERSLQAGVRIEFFDSFKGDRKIALATKAPVKAVDILQSYPEALVVVMPDLYPRNKGFAHETFEQLAAGIRRNFDAAVATKGLADHPALADRFRVFCFKHDLEALLLAAEEELQRQFNDQPLGVEWRKPVEDQDQDNPPKFIVEQIYRNHGKRFKETVDAPRVLRGAGYRKVAERCPQCFQPFVDFLEGLAQ
ncbi:MAG: DUF4276 family protein [Chloroflexi bacterium]|nr:DUF4276 family protein [Chloroflexota bacterium]